MHEAICDTSPIQYLHQIGFLHLLAAFYTRTLVPPAVAGELERGRAIGIDLPLIRALPWVKIVVPEGWIKYHRPRIWMPEREKCRPWEYKFQTPS